MIDENGVEVLEQGDIFTGSNQPTESQQSGSVFTQGTGGTDPTNNLSGGGSQQQQIIIVGTENKEAETGNKGEIESNTETIDYTTLLEAIERKINTTNQYLVVTNNNNLLYYKTNIQMMGLIIGMLLIFLFIGRLR